MQDEYFFVSFDAQIIYSGNVEHAPLGVEFLINDTKYLDTTLEYFRTFKFIVRDTEDTYKLNFILKDKSLSQTQCDSSGNITGDTLLEIKNIQIDNVCLDEILYEKANYTHMKNTESSDHATSESFCGTMGCNGSVEFTFESPFYVWLLENMN
jgi:hypothetical protein